MIKRLTQKGFTIIEMVVVLPIVSIIAIGIITLVMNMFFQIMANNSRLNLLLEAQTVLLSLQDELLFTTNFGEGIMNNLGDAYAPTGGWTFDTSPNTLIIYETTLTAPRRDPDREFVFNGSCNGPIAFDNVIYFTEQNDTNPYHTLYRRILTPQYSTCNSNYRVQTCPAIFVGTLPCESPDSVISDRVIDFNIEYYDSNNNLIDTASSGTPLDGEKITINLTLGDNLFGRNVNAESSITMRKVN